MNHGWVDEACACQSPSLVVVREAPDLYPVFDRLQEQLEKGATIKFQDGHWYLFSASGEALIWGDTIRGMFVNLAMSGL